MQIKYIKYVRQIRSEIVFYKKLKRSLELIVIVSPAKKLDFDSPSPTTTHSQLKNLDKSVTLIKELRKCSPAQISKMMKLSDALTDLNVKRYKSFKTPFTTNNSKQAMYAFKGDTYVGLDAETMNKKEINYAQKHLRILSGLYGLVSPLDLVQPYRLEMGTKFSCDGKKNLYEYWKESITGNLNTLLKKEKTLVNLASKEYFTAIDFKQLQGDVITPVFKEKKGNDYKIVSFFAKKARGMMSRYIIDQQIEDAKDLLKFSVDGYKYNKGLSSYNEPVFTRG